MLIFRYYIQEKIVFQMLRRNYFCKSSLESSQLPLEFSNNFIKIRIKYYLIKFILKEKILST